MPLLQTEIYIDGGETCFRTRFQSSWFYNIFRIENMVRELHQNYPVLSCFTYFTPIILL